MQVDYPTPFLREQEVIRDIHTELVNQYPNAKIVIVDRTARAGFVTVSAKIEDDGKETSVCHGQVLADSFPVDNLLKAEIIALTMCCAEKGLHIQFTGTAESLKSPDVSMAADHVKFDRAFIMSCGTVPNLIEKMHALGLDTAPLEAEIKRYKMEGKHISIQRAAKFLIQSKDVAYHVKQQKKEATVSAKEPEKRKAVRTAPIQQGTRTAQEVQEIYKRLLASGVTDADAKTAGFGFLIQVGQLGTDEQIEELIAKKS